MVVENIVIMSFQTSRSTVQVPRVLSELSCVANYSRIIMMVIGNWYGTQNQKSGDQKEKKDFIICSRSSYGSVCPESLALDLAVDK